MNYNILIGIGAFLASYHVIRYFFLRRIQKVVDVDKELATILNNDKYKVKGRFE